MRQFTIAERLFAATLLPLVGMLAMPYLATVLVPFMDAGTAAYAQVFIAMVIASVAVAVVSPSPIRLRGRWQSQPIPSTPWTP
jgi:hypothetical protein